mgnify:CR=1 FL=1
MSLKIIIDGKEAALPADTEVCLKLHNYFFEDRDNDATYPITLNLNANRHIFGYPERISEKIHPTEYDQQRARQSLQRICMEYVPGYPH